MRPGGDETLRRGWTSWVTGGGDSERRISDGTYLRLNPGWHAEDSAWKVARIAQIIDRNRLKPNTVAEVGCGAGQSLHQLSKIYPGTGFYGLMYRKS